MNNHFDHLLCWEFWKRQMVYRTTCCRITWKLRLLLAVLILLLPIATRGWWATPLGSSLVCNMSIEKPDLILIDNLDTNYLLFEKARDLEKKGCGAPVLVPVSASRDNPETLNLVSQEFAEVMIRLARIAKVQIIPVKHEEPITLNTARHVSDHIRGSNIRTVLVLTSGFKSKRIHLIFQQVLAEVGIQAYCLPVWGAHRADNWMESWHGIEEVLMQSLKLAYYRLWVLKGRDT